MKHTKNKMLKYLIEKRHMTVSLLGLDLTGLSDRDEIISHFNNELNMCQFVIDNIDNKKSLEDNPYFWQWIDDNIEFFNSTDKDLFVLFENFRKLIKGDLK